MCVCVRVQLVQALRYETPEFLDPQLADEEEDEEEKGLDGKTENEEEKKDLSLEATYSEGEQVSTYVILYIIILLHPSIFIMLISYLTISKP